MPPNALEYVHWDIMLKSRATAEGALAPKMVTQGQYVPNAR